MVKPRVVRIDDESVLERLKEHIAEPGGLVAIPTETVYGLAANALCEVSVRKIFQVKQRPLTDPLIVHLPSFSEALKRIYNVDLYETFIITHLAKRFSPGPLTIVAKGRKDVPQILSAGTGYPAVRCPSHPIALKLLRYSGMPLAAPSANKFGHISPTSVEHVLSEFPDEFMYIIDGGTCEIGIESTVVKIDSDQSASVGVHSQFANYKEIEDLVDALSSSNYVESDNRWKELLEQIRDKSAAKVLTILRKGAVTLEMLQKSLVADIFKNVKVEHKVTSLSNQEVCESPGMLLRHYSPNVPTYRVSLDSDKGSHDIPANTIAMIDVGGKFKDWRSHFMQYLEVSDDSCTVAKQLYSILRDVESFSMDNDQSTIAIYYENKRGDLDEAIHDRIHRATSGKHIYCKVTNEISFKW